MNLFHTDVVGRWSGFSLCFQLANVGSEVGRAISWRKKGKKNLYLNALYRALELLDLTVEDAKNKSSLKEILRVRETLVDYFEGSNIYKSTDEAWEKYFYPFTFAARSHS